MGRLWLGSPSIKNFKNGNGTFFYWSKLTTPTWWLIGCLKHIWPWCELDTYPLGWRHGWMCGWWCTWMNSPPPFSLSLSSTLSKKNCRRIDSFVEFLRPEPTIASQVRRISSTNSRNRFALVFFFWVFSPPSKIPWRMVVGRVCLFRRRIFVSEEHLCVCVFFWAIFEGSRIFRRPCWRGIETRYLFLIFNFDFYHSFDV